ncbi:MAG: hypothetical protein AAGE86_07695 [Pseudomonadota bacterium]
MAVLKASQFAIAFAFARSEAAQQRNSLGQLVTAAVDAPRFDHSPDGDKRGLLTTAGSDIGTQDRVIFDPLMLPVTLTDSDDLREREATVFHAFRPDTGLPDIFDEDQDTFDAGIERRAFYSRDAARTIDRLMNLQGHHLSIGVQAGFAENREGFARYRGALWQLPDLIAANGGVLATDDARPLIMSGAELVAG